MPELPEVETTRRGLLPHISGRTFKNSIIRNASLRWPVPIFLESGLTGQSVETIERRGKYLLFRCTSGTLMIHLGMSGSLRIVLPDEAPTKHDHIDLIFNSSHVLRYHDPRRFGSFHWIKHGEGHPLLTSLGPEPLSEQFEGNYLFMQSRGRRASVKQLIMNGKIVVGVGNIYASEALFLSGIRPGNSSMRISRKRYCKLATSIKAVLELAIERGGTTLRDFVGASGAPGYFSLKLNVYGREGKKCNRCETAIRCKVLGQRTSFYCPTCQT